MPFGPFKKKDSIKKEEEKTAEEKKTTEEKKATEEAKEVCFSFGSNVTYCILCCCILCYLLPIFINNR